ncbi:MAG: recombinase family protein, partial [Bacillota bacterium]
MRLKVAVYCRVSTDEQADARTIQNQVDFAVKYCRLHGLDVYDYYLDDGVSGAVPVESRRAGGRLMADALKGLFGAVYVYRLDRLARTTLDILKTHQKLSEAGVALRSMTENFDTSTPSGKFFMTTLGGIAEIERETIAERMRAGKDRALREGRWPGGPPPYGYALSGKRLVINKCEADIVRKIFSLYTEGDLSTASIADYLNATGVPAPQEARGNAGGGKRWHGSRVWNILSNTAYRGVFLYGKRGCKNPVELECPPIISAARWDQAREVRKRKALYSARNARREYLLKGLMRCGICGGTYMGDGSGKGGRNCYYRCGGSTSLRPGLQRCPSKSVRADLIEKIIWDDVCSYVLNARQVLDRIYGRLPRRLEDGGGGNEADVIERSLRIKERQRKRIILLFSREMISEEEAGEQLSGILREIEALHRRREELDAPVRIPSPPPLPPELMPRLKKRLLTAGINEKRTLIRGLLEGITVDTVMHGGKETPRVVVFYAFGGLPDCTLFVET